MKIASPASDAQRLCLFRALAATLFPVGVVALFWKHHLGLSMTQIMLVTGVLGLAMLLFEIPAGYLADRFGYKKTLVASSCVSVLGWTLYAFADSFGALVCAELALGAGMAFVSKGAQAMLYDSLVEEGRSGEFAAWEAKAQRWCQSAEVLSALCAGVLFMAWERLPFLLMVGVWVANAHLAWQLSEPKRHTQVPQGHWGQARAMVHFAMVMNRRLTALAFLSVAAGLTTLLPVWMIAIYATEAGMSPAGVGCLWALAAWASCAGARASERSVEARGLMPTLMGSIALSAVAYLGLGLVTEAWGFAFYFLLTFSGGVLLSSLSHEEGRVVARFDLAGFKALRSVLVRIGYLALAPCVGVAVDLNGMHSALLAIGLLTLAGNLAGWSWLRRERAPRRVAAGVV